MTERAKLAIWFDVCGSVAEVQRRFRTEFNERNRVPSRNLILSTHERLLATGSVLPKKRGPDAGTRKVTFFSKNRRKKTRVRTAMSEVSKKTLTSRLPLAKNRRSISSSVPEILIFKNHPKLWDTLYFNYNLLFAP